MVKIIALVLAFLVLAVSVVSATEDTVRKGRFNRKLLH